MENGELEYRRQVDADDWWLWILSGNRDLVLGVFTSVVLRLPVNTALHFSEPVYRAIVMNEIDRSCCQGAMNKKKRKQAFDCMCR
jgi:hypothetical protein